MNHRGVMERVRAFTGKVLPCANERRDICASQELEVQDWRW